MPKRICAKCGKEHDIYHGKICENDHFICKYCAYEHHHCPVCGKRMK